MTGRGATLPLTFLVRDAFVDIWVFIEEDTSFCKDWRCRDTHFATGKLRAEWGVKASACRSRARCTSPSDVEERVHDGEDSETKLFLFFQGMGPAEEIGRRSTRIRNWLTWGNLDRLSPAGKFPQAPAFSEYCTGSLIFCLFIRFSSPIHHVLWDTTCAVVTLNSKKFDWKRDKIWLKSQPVVFRVSVNRLWS